MAKVKFKVGDIVQLRKDSEWCLSDYANKTSTNPLNINGVITSLNGSGKIVKLPIDVLWDNKTTNQYNEKDLFLITKTETMNITKTEMKNAVEAVANQLASKIGRVTTLELKNELRKVYPAVIWNQYKTGKVEGVSDLFHELVREGKFYSVADNGTYQTYQPISVRKTSTVAKLGKAIAKANPKKTLSVAKVASKGAKTPVPVATKVVDLAKFGKGKKIARSKALDLMKNNKGHFFTVVFTKQDGSLRKLNGQYVKDQTPSALGYVLVKEASKLKEKAKEPIRNVNLQTLKLLKAGGQVYTF